MGTWRVTSDLLAKARFTVSPKAEAVAALEALVRPSDPAERAFRAAHRVAFEAMLDERPVRRDLVSHSFRPRRGSQSGWVADFLTSPPSALTRMVYPFLEVQAEPKLRGRAMELLRGLKKT